MNYAAANGLGGQPGVSESLSPDANAAAAVAAVRQQMCNMIAAAQHHPDAANLVSGFNLPAHCGSMSILPTGGGSSGGIQIPKLGSPAASAHSNNNGGTGSIPIPRLGSPAVSGSSNSHGMSSLMHGLHSIHGLTGGGSTPSAGSHCGTNNSSSGSGGEGGSRDRERDRSGHRESSSRDMGNHSGNAMSHLNSGSLSITRLGSPANSAHDLRMTSPEESPLSSPLGMALEPAVNLAVGGSVEVGIGLSGMSYKSSRNYSSPRPDHLFQDDIADLVATSRSSRVNSFKETTIKIEPLTECRGD